MLLRFLIAGVGAIVVTTGLFLTMDAVTSLFRDRDMQRYFRINDILPKPEPGRPERPPPVAIPPRGPVVPAFEPDSRLPTGAPIVPPAPLRPPVVLDPRLPLPEPPAPAAPTGPDTGPAE